MIELLALVLCCFFSINAERLPVRTFTVADGLLRDQVSRIRQDSRGFLWFCTAEGVSRFDGTGFVNFRAEDGLPDRHANDILETSRGEYLIATDKGLARLNPKGIPRSKENPLFTVISPEDPKAQAIGVLFEDRAGTVWVGTANGLYRFAETNGQFALDKFPIENFGVVAIIQDRVGTVWAGGETGAEGKLVRIFPDGKFEQYSSESGLPKSQIASLLETSDGRIWAGLRPGEKDFGVLRFVGEPAPGKPIVERSWTTTDGLPVNWIPSLFQSSDGKMWLGTTSGLCLWQGENSDSVCRTFTAKNDLCDEGVSSLIEDKDGNLWAGTGCGAKKLARHGFTIYGEADNLDRAIVSSIFENETGELFVSTRKKQLAISRFGEGGFRTVLPEIPREVTYHGWGWKQLSFHDSTGAWWIPTGEGLFRSRPKTRYEDLGRSGLEKIETGAKSKEVFRIFEDSRGDVWIATIGGGGHELWRWQRASGVWENMTEKAGFAPHTIGTVFIEDKRGNLWIATGSDSDDSRLIRYRNGNFRTFTEAEGSPLRWTRDLFVDDHGRLWLANTAMGLLRLDDVNSERLNFKRYSIAEGLSSSAVYCVTGDAFGRIYAGTGRGIDRLSPESGQIENFTTADGLPNSFVEVAYRDRKNDLWFATHNGLVRFQPTPENLRKPPTALITHLQIGGRTQPVSILGEKEIGNLDLASDENQVRVEFIGLGASVDEKLHFEYRIADENWTPTNELALNFANLSAGNYRFEVRALSADRLFSDPAVFSFRIASPIWQRWWFVLIVSAFLLGVVYLVYRTRLQRLLEMERMRTRIATDLHDDIGANLTRISILSEVAKQKAENGNGGLLSSIADIARESVASMNDIVWAVSPEHDSLLDLTRRMRRHAEEVFSFRDVDLRFEAPETDAGLKLGVGIRRDLLLVFKESVNNAAKHSGCTKVEIALKVEHSKLILEVFDDGRGFAVNESDGIGQGLRSMSRRATAVGGELALNTKQGRGTRVKLVLPVAKTEQD